MSRKMERRVAQAQQATPTDKLVSVQALKARVYDLMVLIENANAAIRECNARIAQLTSGKPEAPPKPEAEASA